MTKTGSLLLALSGLFALSSAPEAHRIQHPKRDGLAFSPGHLALSLTLDIEGGEEASALRERYDRNGDGLMDQDEAEALQTYLVKEAQKTLHLTVNGKAPTLMVTSRATASISQGPPGSTSASSRSSRAPSPPLPRLM